MRSRDATRFPDEHEVESSKRLAGVIGPALIALTASELVNLDFLEKQYRNYSYLNGSVVFVAGPLIVRAHNRWTPRWPIAVTLTGWVLIGWRLFRMFFPDAQQGGASPTTYVGILIPLADGIFLTYKAYRPSRAEPLDQT